MPGQDDGASSSPSVVVSVIAKLLTDVVAKNDQLSGATAAVTPFHSSRPPAISIKSYLEDRILKYAGVSEETVILALIYIDQVVQFNPDFVISSLNVHRLLITATVLASKFFDDVYYNNAYYARVGGISNLEVNSLEMEMLRMISFSLFVQPEEYERYRRSLYALDPAEGGGGGAAGAAGHVGGHPWAQHPPSGGHVGCGGLGGAGAGAIGPGGVPMPSAPPGGAAAGVQIAGAAGGVALASGGLAAPQGCAAEMRHAVMDAAGSGRVGQAFGAPGVPAVAPPGASVGVGMPMRGGGFGSVAASPGGDAMDTEG